MDQTLVIVWACTWVAFTIMVVRLLLRKLRRQPFGAGDYLTMAAIFCLLARLGLIHVVLVLGSNNMSAAARKKLKLTPQVIYQREVGSKLTLVNRCFYNSLYVPLLSWVTRHRVFPTTALHMQWTMG